MKQTTQTGLILFIIFVMALGLRGYTLMQVHHANYYNGISDESGIVALNFFMGRGLIFSDIDAHKAAGLQPQDPRRLIDPIEYKDQIGSSVSYYSAHEVPGYALMLAATWKIFGQERYIYLQILQIILDSLLVFVIFWIGKKLMNSTVGIIAATLFALFIPEAQTAAAPLRDVWPVIITTATLALLIKTKDTPERKKRMLFYLIIGIILGIGILIHPILQYLNVFLAVAIIFYHNKKDALAFFIITTTAIFLILSPWIIRNYQLFGRIITTRDVVWQGIWEGWGQFPDNPMGAKLSDTETYEDIRAQGHNVKYGTPPYNDILKEKSLAALRQNPIWALSAMIRRIPDLFFLQYGVGHLIPPQTLPPFRQDVKTFRETPTISSFVSVVWNHPSITLLLLLEKYEVLGILLLALGAFGGVIILRKRWWELSILATTVFYFFVVLLPLHVESRYLLSVFPVYFLLAAVTLYLASVQAKKLLLPCYTELKKFYASQRC